MTEAETIAAAMGLLGRRTSPAKKASSTANGQASAAKHRGVPRSEKTKEKIRAGALRRWALKHAADLDRNGS